MSKNAMLPESQKAVQLLKVQFGLNVKRYRKKASLSQLELGQKTGQTQPQISAIENGRANISFEKMALVTFALKKTVSDMFLWQKNNLNDKFYQLGHRPCNFSVLELLDRTFCLFS